MNGVVSFGDLAAIRDRKCALAIRPRERSAELAAAIAAVDLAEARPLLLGAAKAQIGDTVGLACRGVYPEDLARDVAACAEELAVICNAAAVSIRLEPVSTDACRRFHADYMTVRMLVTYIGPGTQWHRADSPDMVEAVGTGHPALLKGRLLLDPPTVLHRSPPISATGERRLLLVVDVVT